MTAEQDGKKTNLIQLGPGEGSKVEHVKAESQYLRGQIVEELQEDTSHFSGDQVNLMKFHGVYQQEDRDVRQARKAAGTEKAYQFMVRSRIPGGVLTAEQYLAQDDIAGQYGNDTMRITTRQGLQLHGILKGDLHATIHSINKSLLSTLAACGDVNRNVMACPAPTNDEAHQRVQEIANQITMRLAPRTSAYHEIWIDGEKAHTIELEDSEPIYGPTYLPRKFKIGIAFPDDNCIDIYTQDIGLIAHVEDAKLTGFSVVIGGGMGNTHGKKETFPRLASLLCDVDLEQVLPLVETIVTVQRDYGDRQNRKHARMKYVVEERGIQWFREQVEERLGYRLRDPRPVEIHNVHDHLGWHEQGDGRWFVGLHIENGRIKDTASKQIRTGLRHVIAHYRPGIRLTALQNILLTDIPTEQRADIEAMLATYAISTKAEDAGAYRFAMACPAMPTCGLALADAERTLPTIMEQIEAEFCSLGLEKEPISVRMTGCPNGCARPYMGDIGFVGRTKDVYSVYVGGDWANTRLNTLYQDSVHVKDLTSTLRPLFTLWKDERLPQESFGDFCHRLGIEHLHVRANEMISANA